MQIITFANSKGGAGKSTALMALASALEATGKTVVVADLDDQGTLASWLAANDGTYRLPDENALSVRQIYFSENDQTNADKTQEALMEIEKEDPDFLLVDTKGKSSHTSAMAMSAADRVICPTNGDSGEYEPVAQTFANLSASLNLIAPDDDPLEFFRIMFTKSLVATGKEVLEARQALRENFTCYNGLPHLTSYNTAHFYGTTLNGLLEKAEADLAKKGKDALKRDRNQVAKLERAVEASTKFMNELLEDLNQ